MTGDNIEEIFSKVTQTIIYKIDSGEIPEELIVNSRAISSNNQTTSLEEYKGQNSSGGYGQNC